MTSSASLYTCCLQLRSTRALALADGLPYMGRFILSSSDYRIETIFIGLIDYAHTFYKLYNIHQSSVVSVTVIIN